MPAFFGNESRTIQSVTCDEMLSAMIRLRTTMRRLYDLEKQYFRQASNKKSRKMSDDEGNQNASKKTSTGPISILGAVAAAGRHLASKRSSAAGGSQIFAQDLAIASKSRKSIDAISSFIRRSSYAKPLYGLQSKENSNKDGSKT